MPKKQLHICALIPTYNNGATVADVVRRTYDFLPHVIVVADGCTDDTLKQLNELKLPIDIVAYARNRGKGYALKRGFQRALELGFDYALTIDSDGQHFPEDIPALLEALQMNPDALIIGSRTHTDANMSGGSKFANRFSNFWFHLQTNISLPDTQTGMRIYPLHHLHGLPLLTSRYEAELELLVFAAWHDVRLVPVPIRVYYPPQEERVSHFKPAYDFTRISILNCFLCIGALLYGYPRRYLLPVLFGLVFALLMLLIVQPLSALYFLLGGWGEAQRLRYHRFLQCFSRLIIKCLPGVNLNINNPLQINLNRGPCLYISNHQSMLDVIVMLAVIPNVVMMTKNWVWNNPLLGLMLRFAQFLPLSNGLETNHERLRKLVQQGYSVLIFPEGTRTPDGRVGHFHRGAFYQAEDLGLEIRPLFLEGLYQMLSKNEFCLRPADITIHVLKPLDDMEGLSYRQVVKRYEKYYREVNNSLLPALAGPKTMNK